MGLFSKHKGRTPRSFAFMVHVHTLTTTANRGRLVVALERHGKRAAATAPTPGASTRGAAAGAVYLFEEALALPATLYEDAAARRAGGPPAFDRKEVQVLVMPADRASKGASAALASLTLDLAECAAAGEGRVQQRTHTLPGGALLVLSIGCRASGGSAEVSQSSLASSAAAAGAAPAASDDDELPTRLSTDDEGERSRPMSRNDSRPGSRAAAAGLEAVPEESGRPASRLDGADSWHQRGVLGAGAAGSSFRQQREQASAMQPAAEVQPAPEEAAAAEVPSLHDADGILIDSADAEVSQEASASVRRNLGSAMERAEASEASRAAGEVEAASSLRAPEVQSRLASSSSGAGAAAAAAAAAAGASAAALGRGDSGRQLLERGASGRQPLAVPPAVLDLQHAELQSPDSEAQSSVLSAGGDPAVPFSVPPSTNRRFAQRGEDGGGAAGTARRWAWRREGAAGAGGGALFQRARIASVGKHDSADGAAAAGGVEASAASATSGSTVELYSRRGTSEEAAAAAALGADAADALPSPTAFGAGAALGMPRTSLDAAAAVAARGRSSSRLLPGLSLLDSLALPSPVDQPTPVSGQPLVEALALELRCLAALESSVYLAGGRRAFAGVGAGGAGANHQLHAPARRLARTILALGPQEGLAFGLQAVRAIEATAGAASGDMHRLTFWWSNALQLRVQLSALLADAGVGPAGSGRPSADWERAGEAGLSPRAALAAAAAKHGLDWLQYLLPPLRELEAWLFSEMLKHLWWRVLLSGVTALQDSAGAGAAASSPHSASNSGAAARGSGSGAGAGNGTDAHVRASTAGSHWAAALARGGGDDPGRASLQGTPRCFETPEEEAVHRWVVGLRGVERALREPGRPCPAPRAHLALLHRQLTVALLRRLDTLLFRKLLADEAEGPPPLLHLTSMGGRGADAFARSAEADEVLGAGAEAAVVAVLDPALLPFQRGAVTFSTGVGLKMAVSRLTHWAADCGVKEDKLPQASTDRADYRLFPCLRATADLLMMPKEVLTDQAIRREVVPGLPLHRICQLLERFQPDDCAPDPLPPGLLEALQGESPRSEGGSTPSPTSKADDEYAPPAEALLLADGVVEPLSLEMGEESEDELEALAGGASSRVGAGAEAAASPTGGMEELRAQRFLLLRDLWASR